MTNYQKVWGGVLCFVIAVLVLAWNFGKYNMDLVEIVIHIFLLWSICRKPTVVGIHRCEWVQTHARHIPGCRFHGTDAASQSVRCAAATTTTTYMIMNFIVLCCTTNKLSNGLHRHLLCTPTRIYFCFVFIGSDTNIRKCLRLSISRTTFSMYGEKCTPHLLTNTMYFLLSKRIDHVL